MKPVDKCARCGQLKPHPVACFGCQTCQFSCDHFICMKYEYPLMKDATPEKTAAFAQHLVDPGPGKPCSGWRWFLDHQNGADYVVLEPRDGEVDGRCITFVDMYDEAYAVAAVFRATPHVGVYLRFRVRHLER